MPNVLIVYDNSGSMAEFAYKTPGYGDSTTKADGSYNAGIQYSGFFEPTKMYKYSSSPGGFQVDTTKTRMTKVSGRAIS